MSNKWMFAVIVASAAWATCTTAAESEPATSDPLTTFKTLNTYIASNPLDFETTYSSRSAVLNTELTSGRTHLIMSQPNLLRMDSTSTKGSFLVVSDGNTITLLDKKKNRYAQTSAPATVGASVNLLTGLLAVEPQVLLFLDAVQSVADGDAKAEASSSGPETVAGRTCNKYALTGSAGAMWDAWLAASDPPLPCKLVSRDADNPDAAVQTNEFKWNAKAAPTADTFQFTPPKDSKLVDFGDLGLNEQ